MGFSRNSDSYSSFQTLVFEQYPILILVGKTSDVVFTVQASISRASAAADHTTSAKVHTCNISSEKWGSVESVAQKQVY